MKHPDQWRDTVDVRLLPFTKVQVTDKKPRYIVTKEITGERLSAIFNNSPGIDIKPYLFKQGALLEQIRQMNIACAAVKDRRFFHLPTQDFLEKNNIGSVYEFLQKIRRLSLQNALFTGTFIMRTFCGTKATFLACWIMNFPV